MINFDSLTQAINYRDWCPICGNEMKFSGINPEQYDLETNSLIFHILKNKIIVQFPSEKVRYEKDSEYNLSSSSPVINFCLNCQKCHNYCYELWLRFSGDKISEIQLANEDFVLNNLNVFNDYYSKNTMLWDVNRETTDVKLLLTCSLIPANWNDPEEIVNKLKKLILFS